MRLSRTFACGALVAASTIVALATPQQQPSQPQQEPAASQSKPPTQAPADKAVTGEGGPAVFRASAEAISLAVTVVDNKGRFVTDLTKEDFGVFEDGKPQPILNFRTVKESATLEPIGAGLVLDVSISMVSGDKLATLVTAARAFMSKMKKTDEVFVVSFATGPVLELPWTTNRESVYSAIRRLKSRPGSNIYDALVGSLPIMEKGTAKKKVFLVFTDGAPDGPIGGESSRIPRSEAGKVLGAGDALVYIMVIGAGGLQGPNTATRQAFLELNQVAAATGGKAILVEGFAELEDEIHKLAGEVSQQYFLEFNRAAEKDGKPHQIVVGVRRKDVVIKHRRTYIAD
jgi:VWFA-related protein